MRDLPAGTITLLFTDIEGSTHLLQQLGERYAELLMECRNLLSAAFHAHSGHEVDTQGDAMFFVFARANDALLAAVDAQRELADVIALRGGVPIKVGDETIGAVGVSGSSAEGDEKCAMVGLAKVADQLR